MAKKSKRTKRSKSKDWSPKPGWKLSGKMLECLREPWSGSVPKKNTKNKMYDCRMFEDRSKPFVLNGPRSAPKIEREHYDLCYKGMYKDCERKTKRGKRGKRGGDKKRTVKKSKKKGRTINQKG